MQSKDKKLVSMLARIELRKIIVYVLFVIVFIFFALTIGNDGFLTQKNLVNILRQSALTGILAFGVTMIIGSGQIDLSVGSTVSLASIMTALMLKWTDSIPLAIITALVVGMTIGAFNATILTITPLPAFLVTLGTQNIVKGLSMWISDTAAVPVYNDKFCQIFGVGKVFGIPVLIVWFLLFAFVTYILLERIPFGRRVLAAGGNRIAADYSGINRKKIYYSVFMLAGMFAGVTALLNVGKMSAAHYAYGEGIEMSIIPAVVLGGTSMAGGAASIVGTFVGAMFMVMLDNGIIIAGMNVSQQMIIKGVVIIFATALGSINFGFLNKKKTQ